jgi:tetratricopeptide (TPR) repeat protein
MYYHAARIAYQLGDAQNATDYLQKALTLNPHFSILYADAAAQWLAALRNSQSP